MKSLRSRRVPIRSMQAHQWRRVKCSDAGHWFCAGCGRIVKRPSGNLQQQTCPGGLR